MLWAVLRYSLEETQGALAVWRESAGGEKTGHNSKEGLQFQTVLVTASNRQAPFYLIYMLELQIIYSEWCSGWQNPTVQFLASWQAFIKNKLYKLISYSKTKVINTKNLSLPNDYVLLWSMLPWLFMIFVSVWWKCYAMLG